MITLLIPHFKRNNNYLQCHKIVLFLCFALTAGTSPANTLNNWQQHLGRLLFTDINLSLNRNRSCASCHSQSPTDADLWEQHHTAAFADPDNINHGTPTSRGSVDAVFGRLNAPSLGYIAFTPRLHFNRAKQQWFGGYFWNGRGASLEAQAMEPFTSSTEMALPDSWEFANRITQNPAYQSAYLKAYGFDLNSLRQTSAATDRERPAPKELHELMSLSGKAIAAYESSGEFSRFTAKYDFVLAGMTELTDLERRGLELFNNKAKCARCHTSDPFTTEEGKPIPPLFTNFGYANIGIPVNPRIPENPPPDNGLFATTKQVSDLGKHKVMSLRNIVLTPPYGHNGFFRSLAEIVYFYNTRDQTPEGWGEIEFPKTANRADLGDLRLTAGEEQAIVAFLETLTDGYPLWGNDPRIPESTPSPFP